MGDKFIRLLLRMRKMFGLKKLSYLWLKLIGVELPLSVQIGSGLVLAHWANGLVVHNSTVIGADVIIYQGVTIGRSDPHKHRHRKIKIVIQNGAILCAGAKILCTDDMLVAGGNSVIGANSVLLNSTGKNEIWGGIPARKLSHRDSANQVGLS